MFEFFKPLILSFYVFAIFVIIIFYTKCGIFFKSLVWAKRSTHIGKPYSFTPSYQRNCLQLRKSETDYGAGKRKGGKKLLLGACPRIWN